MHFLKQWSNDNDFGLIFLINFRILHFQLETEIIDGYIQAYLGFFSWYRRSGFLFLFGFFIFLLLKGIFVLPMLLDEFGLFVNLLLFGLFGRDLG